MGAGGEGKKGKETKSVFALHLQHPRGPIIMKYKLPLPFYPPPMLHILKAGCWKV